ncbi:MAG: helix-turn-helix domain-containing protein [Chitinivibrionales bacterium]|nr:helix-turn-helix domain-containing protein [Chitinivibrionales bacterium]
MRVERYLTKADVEATLQLHRNTVSRLLAKGCFPGAFRTGGRWRIPVRDLEIFAESGKANPICVAPRHAESGMDRGEKSISQTGTAQ